MNQPISNTSKKRKEENHKEFYFPRRLFPVCFHLIEYHVDPQNKGSGRSIRYSELAGTKSKSAVSRDIREICKLVVKVNKLPYPPKYKLLCRRIDIGKALAKVIETIPLDPIQYAKPIHENLGYLKYKKRWMSCGKNELDEDGEPRGTYSELDRRIDEDQKYRKEMMVYLALGGGEA